MTRYNSFDDWFFDFNRDLSFKTISKKRWQSGMIEHLAANFSLLTDFITAKRSPNEKAEKLNALKPYLKLFAKRLNKNAEFFAKKLGVYIKIFMLILGQNVREFTLGLDQNIKGFIRGINKNTRLFAEGILPNITFFTQALTDENILFFGAGLGTNAKSFAQALGENGVNKFLITLTKRKLKNFQTALGFQNSIYFRKSGNLPSLHDSGVSFQKFCLRCKSQIFTGNITSCPDCSSIYCKNCFEILSNSKRKCINKNCKHMFSYSGIR